MNFMAELSEVWGMDADLTWASAGNPLPYFERAFCQVEALIVETCRARSCTYAELLEGVRKADPVLVEEYLSTFNQVDCDVYGKWCSGELTEDEYQLFCTRVDRWRDSASRMSKIVERVPV